MKEKIIKIIQNILKIQFEAVILFPILFGVFLFFIFLSVYLGELLEDWLENMGILDIIWLILLSGLVLGAIVIPIVFLLYHIMVYLVEKFKEKFKNLRKKKLRKNAQRWAIFIANNTQPR